VDGGKMGIMDKMKNIFGGKKEDPYENEQPARIEKAPEIEEDDTGERWKTAKKWREQQAMNEPLIKRDGFKRRI
jgi:hypothetical protein